MDNVYELALDIYKTDDGVNWYLVDIVYGKSEQECQDEATKKYSGDEFHWTSPVETGRTIQ